MVAEGVEVEVLDLLLVGLLEVVDLCVVLALAGRGGEGSSDWCWFGAGDGGSVCCQGGWKKGGRGKVALWLCSLSEIRFRRLRWMVHAAFYKVWRCFFPADGGTAIPATHRSFGCGSGSIRVLLWQLRVVLALFGTLL